MTTYLLILVLILIVAVALTLIVMVQNPKGGGLSSSFGGSGTQSLGGVQNTNSFLDNATWTLAITMFALILFANFTIPRESTNDSQLENTLKNTEKTSSPRKQNKASTPKKITTLKKDSTK